MRKLVILLLLPFIFWGCMLDKEAAYKMANLGNEKYNNGNYEEAITDYKKALELDPKLNVEKNLGLTFLKNNQLEKAIDIFEKVEDDETNFLLGNIYVKYGNSEKTIDEKIKNYKKALEKYKKAIKLNTRDKNYKFNYELIKKRINDLQDKMKQDHQDKDQEDKNKEDQKNKTDNQEQQKKSQNEKNQENKEKENKKKNSDEKSKQEESQNKEENTKKENKEENEEKKQNKMEQDGDKEEAQNIQKLNEEEIKKARQILEALKQQEKNDLKNNQRILRVPQDGENKKNW